MKSISAHMSEPLAASFKGPLPFKDRGGVDLRVRMDRLNEMFHIAIEALDQVRTEMVALVAESRALKLPIVLRTKLGGGTQPGFRMNEPRTDREQAIKLIWIGRAAAQQTKTDPVPFMPEIPELVDLCARASELNMRMRITLCQSTNARESLHELEKLAAVALPRAA